MEESEGFEPSGRCRPSVFETDTISLSANSPCMADTVGFEPTGHFCPSTFQADAISLSTKYPDILIRKCRDRTYPVIMIKGNQTLRRVQI
jgi:hypothetical protein